MIRQDNNSKKARKSVIALIVLSSFVLAACQEQTQIVCWGGNEKAAAPAPDKFSPKQYSVTKGVACAIGQDDKLKCWGESSDKYDKAMLEGAPIGATVKYVDLKDLMGCVINADDRAYCWGDNFENALGLNNEQKKFVSLAADSMGACGVEANGTVTCSGRLANMHRQNKWMGMLPQNIQSIAIGGQSVCWQAKDSSEVECLNYYYPNEKKRLKFTGGAVKYNFANYNRVWIIDRNQRLNYFDDDWNGPVIENGLSGFGQSFSTCRIDTIGKASCEDIRGGKAFPFSIANTVPKDVTFKSLQVGSRIACGIIKI